MSVPLPMSSPQADGYTDPNEMVCDRCKGRYPGHVIYCPKDAGVLLRRHVEPVAADDDLRLAPLTLGTTPAVLHGPETPFEHAGNALQLAANVVARGLTSDGYYGWSAEEMAGLRARLRAIQRGER